METNNHNDLLKRHKDDLSPQEQDQVNAMLASSPDARKLHAEHTSVQRMLHTHGQSKFSDGFADRVMQAIAVEDRPATATVYRLSPYSYLKAAAVILLLVGISAIVWMQPRSYTVPNGRQVQRILPDGSAVLLSSGSTLSYKPFWGRKIREVRLEGEAFFDVTSSEKPFIVETFNAEVRVLGTRFNVKAWPASHTNYTAVTLEEGRVEVTAERAPNHPVELMPSQSTIVYADSTQPQRRQLNVLDYALTWKTGGLGFENEPLANVIDELSRRYNVHLTAPQELSNLRIGYLKPNPVPLDTVLAELSYSFNFQYRPIANGFELFTP